MRCFIKCQTFVLFALTFSLLVVLCGLGLSLYYKEIPIPERLLKVLKDHLKEEGLSIQYDSISIDFTGDILIKNGRVSFTETSEPALEVDLLFIDLNYPAIILGRTPFNAIKLSGARIYSLAIVSPTGTNEKLIDHVNLAISRRWNRWNLEFFTAKFQHLDIVARGNLSGLIANLEISEKKEEEREDIYSLYLQFTRSLSDQIKNLKYVEAPKITINCVTPSDDSFLLNVDLIAEDIAVEGFPATRNFHARAALQIFPTVQTIEPIHLTAASVTQKELQLEVEKVRASAWTNHSINSLESVFPLHLQFTTGPIDVQGTALKQSLFDGQILGPDNAQGRLIASLYEGAVEATLAANWKQQIASGSLSGGIDLTSIFDRPEFESLRKLRWSKQSNPAYLDIDFDYPGNLDELSASFRVETRDIDIIKTPFEWVRVRGTLKGTYADIYQLEGGGYGNDLFCTFRQDLTNPFYRFTMAGRFRPHDIDPWWRDWWKNTFDYLDIKGELPWMDMAIRNTFTQKKQMSLFGFAEAENIALKDMHFDKASVKMFIRPNYIDAFELNLERPEGTASGQFQRHLEFSKLKNVIIDIESNLDLETSMELFEENGRRIIEPYTWYGHPHLKVAGEFNFENDDNWQDLHFEIETDQPMTVYEFPLDSLKVSGHYGRGDVQLEDIQFGFAGGNGEGDVTFLKQNDQSFFLFDFDIENAELEETLDRIVQIKPSKVDDNPTEPTQEKKNEPLQGKLKVHASGISPAGYGLERVMAKGNIEITEGNLAQIPLFGPLSSLMPFTTLRLNSANAYFAWDDGKMTFPDLVMTGNTARLEGIGDYYTHSSDLDFQVRVFLFRETNIPLVSNIIMPLFDPFSEMAAVNLKGTLTKPEWRFAMSPFNIFNPKVEESRSKTNEELLDFEFIK